MKNKKGSMIRSGRRMSAKLVFASSPSLPNRCNPNDATATGRRQQTNSKIPHSTTNQSCVSGGSANWKGRIIAPTEDWSYDINMQVQLLLPTFRPSFPDNGMRMSISSAGSNPTMQGGTTSLLSQELRIWAVDSAFTS